MKLLFQPKLKWILVICILAGLSFFSIYQYNTPLWREAVKCYYTLQDHHRLKGIILSYGAYSPLAFILLQIVQVVVAPIPGGAIEFIGGYIFGVGAGFLYSMVGLLIGSSLAFGSGRIFEKWAVEKFVSEEVRRKFDYLVGHEGVILSFLLFLIPGFPKDALCYLLGLTPMHFGIFLIVSTIGRVPGTVMATLQGAKAFDHQYKIFFLLLGISALVILVFYIYHVDIHHQIQKLKGEKDKGSE